jgi:HlyD family secretion protein
MSASADIQTKTKQHVLSVPLNAVTTRSNKVDKPKTDKKDDKAPVDTAAEVFDEVVFVVQKGDSLKMAKVKTGIQDINNIELTDGIKSGDEVVIAPYTLISKTLKTGNKVKVVAKDKLFEDDKK